MLFCRHIIEDSSLNLKIPFHKYSTKNWSAFIRINGFFVVTIGQLFVTVPIMTAEIIFWLKNYRLIEVNIKTGN